MSFKKRDVFEGVIWSAIDKFSVVIIQIILEVVMARLLLPKDYGVIGIATVFIAIGQVFVDSGFSNALIQKQDRNEADYSTAFYFNILLSIGFYILVFSLAPYISIFFKIPVLTKVVRVIGLGVIVNSFTLVHKAKLAVSLNFKTQAKYSLAAVCISGILGVVLAYNNYGVWALVCQSLFSNILNTFFYWIRSKWRPLLLFSQSSFRALFYFGSKLLLANLIQAFYQNSYSFVIGKKFSSSELGVFSKATQFTLMPVGLLTNVLQRVSYPFLATYQNNNEKLYFLNLRYTSLIAIITFPSFICIATLANPIVRILLSDTWIRMVPILRLLAIAYMFYPFININMYLFQIKGKTGLFLKVEILVKILGLIILLITIPFGITIICVGIGVQMVLQMVVTSFLANNLLGRNMFSQLKNIISLLVPCMLIGFTVFAIIQSITSTLSQLVIGSILYIILFAIYFVLVKKSEIKSLSEVFQ